MAEFSSDPSKIGSSNRTLLFALDGAHSKGAIQASRTLVFQLGDAHLGAIGPKGKPGIQGRPGRTGQPGVIGPDGKEGPQGIAGSGTGDFIGLLDTPPDYIGNTHQILRVNATANAVEFTNSIQAGSF